MTRRCTHTTSASGSALRGGVVALVCLVGPLAGAARATPQLSMISDDGRLSARLGTNLQLRYGLESVPAGRGKRDSHSAFSIPRLRVKLSGHAWRTELTYAIEFDLGANGAPGLRDGFLNAALRPGLQIRAGQWKKPFARGFLLSSSRQGLITSPLTWSHFDAARDIGVALHNGLSEDPPVAWSVGVFNGTGIDPHYQGDVQVDPTTGGGVLLDAAASNVPRMLAPAVVGRLVFNHGDIGGSDEVDLAGGALRWSVGASAMALLNADQDRSSGTRSQLDVAAKAHGWSVVAGAYLATDQQRRNFKSQGYSGTGADLSVSYAARPLVVPALRLAAVQPSGDGRRLLQALVGTACFFEGHGFKWTNELGMRSEEGNRAVYIAHSQLQLAF